MMQRRFQAALLAIVAIVAVGTLFPDREVRPLATTRVNNLEITGTTDATGNILARAGVQLTDTTGPTIVAIASNPDGAVAAAQGALRLRTDTGELYQNIDGATAWNVVYDARSLSVTHTARFTGTGSAGSSLELAIAGGTCAPGQAVTSVSATGVATCADVATTTVGVSRMSDVAIANTETVVLSYTAPANTLTAGETFFFQSGSKQAGATASNPVYRIRIGTTTLTGNVVVGLTGPSNGTATDLLADGFFTIRTVGAGGTAAGSMAVHKQSGTVLSINGAANAPVAVDTTVQNLIEVTLISGNAGTTHTVQSAHLERAF